MKRKRHSVEQWVEWLREQPGSGLSVEAFCRNKDVSTNSFYVWRRKLAQELTSRPASPFIPLTVIDRVAWRREDSGSWR